MDLQTFLADDRPIIISLCDITGAMVEPWIEGGYAAILVDPLHPEGLTISDDGSTLKVGYVLDHPCAWRSIRAAIATGRVAFVAAFPPCTDLTNSGAHLFQKKAVADPAFQHHAMRLVIQCQSVAELSGAPYLIENPAGKISTFWRKPDHRFDPCDFTAYEPADNYTKRTHLWGGNGFKMPEPMKDDSLGEADAKRILHVPGGKRQAGIRSKTPLGFARAVYQANALPSAERL